MNVREELLEFGLTEITVFTIHRFELTSINSDQFSTQSAKLFASECTLSANLLEGSSIIFAKISNGFEIGCELTQ